MPKTPAQAISFARNNKTFEPGFCLRYVRTAYGVDPFFASAADAWRGATAKHRVKSGMQVPRGAPVYWTGGSQGFGHIAIATGNGGCWSTDAGGSGVVAKVNIDELTQRFNIDFQGWAEDVNKVRVFDTGPLVKPADMPIVKLAKVVPQPEEDVRAVQRALKRRLKDRAKDVPLDGFFGKETRDAYALWQRRCGFSGKDANGIPGSVSLERLGFKVR